MARARTKKELLEFGEVEYNQLLEQLDKLSSSEISKMEVFNNRTPKDIVAHLLSWQLLFMQWYKVGIKGGKPSIPAEGYTWKTTPELNEKLYEEYKDRSYKQILAQFKSHHKKLMKLIKEHGANELEEKKRYPWTGSTNMASYLASATSSHYNWAFKLISKSNKASCI